MNSFNTQLQIEDMYDQDEYAALLHYCESRDHATQYEDRDAQELHWEDIRAKIDGEFFDNQPKPF